MQPRPESGSEIPQYEYPTAGQIMADMIARGRRTGQALTAPRRPLANPDDFMDESQVPRENIRVTALKNALNAVLEASSADNSIPMGGGRGFDPTGATNVAAGTIGKFERASKKGNVIHAAREFLPMNYGHRNLPEISEANKLIPKGAPGPIGGLNQPTIEMIPEGLDFSGFNKQELKEALDRIWTDRGVVYNDPRYNLDAAPFSQAERAIRDQEARLAEIEALTKRPTVRHTYNEGIQKDLARESRWADDEMKPIIERLRKENIVRPGSVYSSIPEPGAPPPKNSGKKKRKK